MPLLDSILSGVAAIGGNIFNTLNTNKNIANQNAVNRQLANEEFQKNLVMWNKGNEYNNPSSQMDRLRKAGLNPMLVYGSGSVTGNTSMQLPRYNAPTANMDVKIPDLTRILSNYQDLMVLQAQTDNARANADLKVAEAKAAKGFSTGYTDPETGEVFSEFHQGIFEQKRKLAEYQAEVAKQTLWDAIKKAGLTNQQIEKVIDNVQSSTELRKSQKLGVDLTNKFMNANVITGIVTKVLNTLGVPSVVSDRFKKPVLHKAIWK